MTSIRPLASYKNTMNRWTSKIDTPSPVGLSEQTPCGRRFELRSTLIRTAWRLALNSVEYFRASGRLARIGLRAYGTVSAGGISIGALGADGSLLVSPKL